MKLSKNEGLSLLSFRWIFLAMYFWVCLAYLEETVGRPFLEECDKQLVEAIQLKVLGTSV